MSNTVKRWIASEIKVCVYIIYECVLCMVIKYIEIQTHACIFLRKIVGLYIKYIDIQYM